MDLTNILFNMQTGMTPKHPSKQRRLSEMRGMYADADAYQQLLAREDVLVYEFYDFGVPAHPEHLAFGTSITYPGTVGNEYFMTKGHFHSIRDTAEVYFCTHGRGYLLLEHTNGDWITEELTPGKAAYVPPGYAHRSINISESEPLVTFFVFRADAGHDYGTIESRGFQKIIVRHNGKPEIIDNPKRR